MLLSWGGGLRKRLACTPVLGEFRRHRCRELAPVTSPKPFGWCYLAHIGVYDREAEEQVTKASDHIDRYRLVRAKLDSLNLRERARGASPRVG